MCVFSLFFLAFVPAHRTFHIIKCIVILAQKFFSLLLLTFFSKIPCRFYNDVLDNANRPQISELYHLININDSSPLLKSRELNLPLWYCFKSLTQNVSNLLISTLLFASVKDCVSEPKKVVKGHLRDLSRPVSCFQ